MNQLSGVKKKDELIFIQKTLKKTTNQDLDIEYIEKNYLKILFKLKSKNKIMIAGSQGSGKSSLSKLIKLYLEKFCYKSVVIISMDDFYLSKSQRTQLSKNPKTVTAQQTAIRPTDNQRVIALGDRGNWGR